LRTSWLVITSGSAGIANCFLGVPVRIRECALQKNQIEPPVKLSAHFAQVGYRFEAELSMKMDRRRIVGIDPSDHDVLAERHRTRKESFDQCAANTAIPSIDSDMN
jgi:hypothetical protein